MKTTKNKLEELEKSIKELSALIQSQEIQRYKRDSEELSELKELISHIHFVVKDAKSYEGDEAGTRKVRITYQLPTIMLDIDQEGKPNKNYFFYAVNKLNLISLEDMKKISNVLEEKNINKSN